MRTLFLIPLLAAALCAPLLAQEKSTVLDSPQLDFSENVAPIFEKYCISCHSDDEPESGLDLSSYKALRKGGDQGVAIVPGKSSESLLIRLVTRKEKPFMPPGKRKAPTTEEIAILRRWIDLGAKTPAKPPVGTHRPKTLEVPHVELTAEPRQPITALAYSPRGDALALGRYAAVELYGVPERKVIRRITGLKGQVMDLVYTHDGTHLITGGGEPSFAGAVDLWNVTTGEHVRSFVGHTDSVLAMALSQDGKVLATGSYDGTIRLWETTTGKQLHQLDGHNAAVFDLAFRPGGTVLGSASGDRTVKLWDAVSGERLETFIEATKEVYTLAFSPDGRRLAAAGVESRIRVWNLAKTVGDGTSQLLYSRYGHEGAIIRLVYSDDGNLLLSSAEDRTVKLWEATALSERFLLKQQPDWPAALDFAPASDQIAVGCMEGTLEFFDVKTGWPQRVAAADGRQSGATAHGSIFLTATLALLGSPDEEKEETKAVLKPELSRVEPRGVAQGTTTRLKLSGQHFESLKEVRFGVEGFTAHIDETKLTDTAAWIDIATSETLKPGAYEIFVATGGGESARQLIYVGDLLHRYDEEPNDTASTGDPIAEASSLWGVLESRGDQDLYAFQATAGATFVVDGEAKRINSKANLVLTLLNPRGQVVASNNDFAGDEDPLIVYTVPTTGVYHVRVRDLTLDGSPDHHYRVSVGTFPFVTSCYPLSIPARTESQVELVGYNLPATTTVTVPAAEPGEQTVAVDPKRFRQRSEVKVLVDDVQQVRETEPNGEPTNATTLPVPGVGHGRIAEGENDADLFRIHASAGQVIVLETEAARHNSPVDTRIEVLDETGAPIDRVVLQAVRDSVVTFRPIDSNSTGVRLEYWEEMELNQFLYINGEVSRLVRRPRGPDSTWDLYTYRSGRRRNYFGTSATAHPLFQPAYIVEAHAPGTRLVLNGLPIFTIPYANDDDSLRELGNDSRLLFTAPQEGDYLIRVTNVKAKHGPRHAYRLHVREAKPDFTVDLNTRSVDVPRGSGRTFTVRANRIDGFDGDIRVDFTGLPSGFVISTPLVIQSGHTEAKGTLYAYPKSAAPNDEALQKIEIVANATILKQEVSHSVAAFEKINVAVEPTFFVSLETFGPPEERRANASWETLQPTGYLSAGGATLTPQDDGSLLPSGVHPKNDLYTITFNTNVQFIEALQVELLPDDSLPDKRHGRGAKGQFVLTGVELSAAPLGEPGESQLIELRNPQASSAVEVSPIEQALDGKPDTGWSVNGSEVATATFELAQVVHFPLGATLTLKLHQGVEKSGVGRFRVLAKGVPATVRPAKPVELTIAPGETISAMIRIERNGHEDRVRFNLDNLPHGVIVDNIGLNGVLVRPGEIEREIFLTCDSWVPETSRLCYAVPSEPRDVATSLPVLLHVKKRTGVAAKP